MRFGLPLGLVALIPCFALIHPFGRVKKENSARPLLQGVSIDATTRSIIGRSCRNCHSEATEWRWYSYIAPVSWLIERDVSRARK